LTTASPNSRLRVIQALAGLSRHEYRSKEMTGAKTNQVDQRQLSITDLLHSITYDWQQTFFFESIV